MICEDCQDSIIFYLKGELTPSEEKEVEAHLKTCDACRRELQLNDRFARAMHNASIPFRRALDGIQVGTLQPPNPPAGETVFTRIGHLVQGRSRVYATAGISILLVVGILVGVFLRRTNAQIDTLAGWAVQHYSMIDQTHPLRGDADTVRVWFRDHHNTDVVPPRKVDYTELVGCKMIDLESDPAPLLRFAGPRPSMVFILPVKYSSIVHEGAEIGIEKDGYRIRLWVEGDHPYMRIEKEREA